MFQSGITQSGTFEGRWPNSAEQVQSLPECLGAIEAGISLARAIEQLLNLRLLVAHHETGGKSAMAVLRRGQTAARTSDYFRE